MTTEEQYALRKAKDLLSKEGYTGQVNVLNKVELILEYTDTPLAYKKAKEFK